MYQNLYENGPLVIELQIRKNESFSNLKVE